MKAAMPRTCSADAVSPGRAPPTGSSPRTRSFSPSPILRSARLQIAVEKVLPEVAPAVKVSRDFRLSSYFTFYKTGGARRAWNVEDRTHLRIWERFFCFVFSMFLAALRDSQRATVRPFGADSPSRNMNCTNLKQTILSEAGFCVLPCI